MVSRPPLSALRAFEAAARLESLSAAGRELNVTHAAVAQQVKRLERWLEASLLQRQGRGVAATEAGRRLADGLSDGFRTIFEAVDAFSADSAARPLRLTATPSFTSNWLVPRLGDFRALYPDVELVIDPTSRLVDLAADGFDAAFRYGMGDWKGVDAVRLVASDMAIGAAVGLIGDLEINEPQDLLALPWLQEASSDEWRTWFEAHGVPDPQHKNIINMPGNLAVDGIRQGLGVGMTARTWIQADVDAGRLVTLFDEEMPSELGYYVVTRPGPHRPALKSFLKWAIDAASTPDGDKGGMHAGG